MAFDKRGRRRLAIGNRCGDKRHAERASQVVTLSIASFSALEWFFALRNGTGNGSKAWDFVFHAEAKLFAHILQLTRLKLGGDIREGSVARLCKGLAERNAT